MRKALFISSAVCILTAGFVAAEAQPRRLQADPFPVRANERYCRDMVIENSATMICMHETLRQCLESRVAPGERCYLNPRLPYSGNQ